MWEQGYVNDPGYYVLKGDYINLNISTRAKKGILEGRICSWNIFMQMHHCNYGYVQINNAFMGTIDEAKRYAEDYLRNLKESIRL